MLLTLNRYSGISWSRASRPDLIKPIDSYAGRSYHRAGDKKKVPTTIAYDDEGEPASWGYMTSLAQEPVKWFKLLLIDDKDVPDHIRHSPELATVKSRMKKLNKKPIEVVADYLRNLWGHSSNQIENEMGDTWMEQCTIRLVVTLPAIWPIYAQVRMRDAVKTAGILDGRDNRSTLTFISEPESAALALMGDIMDRVDIKVCLC